MDLYDTNPSTTNHNGRLGYKLSRSRSICPTCANISSKSGHVVKTARNRKYARQQVCQVVQTACTVRDKQYGRPLTFVSSVLLTGASAGSQSMSTKSPSGVGQRSLQYPSGYEKEGADEESNCVRKGSEAARGAVEKEESLVASIVVSSGLAPIRVRVIDKGTRS